MGKDKVYHGSEITSIHGLDSDRFGYLDLDDAVEKLGYVSWSSLLYKVPKTEVYKSLHNDKDVMEMLSHLSQKCRLFSVYVDKGNKARDMVEKMIVNASIDGGVSADAIGNARIENEVTSDKDLVVYENEVGEGVESDYEPDNLDEDISYNPVGEENDTDDSLDDDELAFDDDEYIQSRLNQRVTMKNIYDNDVCANNVMSCGEHAHGDSFKATVEAFVSDYEESDVEVNSDSTEERDNMIRKPRKVTYDPKCDHKSLKLVIGMQFEDGFQCKHAIQTISIENGDPIRFTRFNKTQCEAKCIPQCGWRCYGSLVKKDGTFVIKSLSGDHKCPREMNNKQATSEWIAREYLNKFRMRPNMSVKELELDIMSRFACEVTPWRLYKAKWKIQEKLRGSVSEHYGGLRRYIVELMKIDKEGRCGLEPINGKTMWPEAVGDPVQPPLLRKMPGRPKKKRRRAADENEPTKSKSARIFGIVITCKRCLQPGHNSRTCKNKPVEQVPREKVRRGRPSKKQVSSASEKMRATKRMSQPSTSKIIARERAEVRKGFGRLEFEGTGHIYTRMPSQKKVHFVNSSFSNPTSRGGKHDREASVSGGKIDVVATQESRS
ncbi:hypothetical protein C2S52_018988 [Perilla frutescens var. hirtella]|nr:hypothetical protein C2S52_018988 [Perilla frutescens var. hirtella]